MRPAGSDASIGSVNARNFAPAALTRSSMSEGLGVIVESNLREAGLYNGCPDLPKGVRSRFVDTQRQTACGCTVLEELGSRRPKGGRSFCCCTVFPNWLTPGAT